MGTLSSRVGRHSRFVAHVRYLRFGTPSWPMCNPSKSQYQEVFEALSTAYEKVGATFHPTEGIYSKFGVSLYRAREAPPYSWIVFIDTYTETRINVPGRDQRMRVFNDAQKGRALECFHCACRMQFQFGVSDVRLAEFLPKEEA